MLGVVAVVMWVARPQQHPSCEAVQPVPDTGATSRMMMGASSAGVANLHPVTSPPARPGEARYYAFGPGVACSFAGLPTNGFYAGISTAEYRRADLCGGYLDVHGPRGDVRALIVDRCPGCAPGQLDLSTAAFEEIADPSVGVAQIRYTVVRDPDPAPELIYELKPDSSSHWLAMLFTGSGNPIQRVALRSASDAPWRELNRGMDNYWTISGAGPGPFSAQVTDIHGHQVEISGIYLEQGPRDTGLSLYTDQAPKPPPASTTVPTPTPQASSSVAATGGKKK
ncbi:expansin EXLX1 family cellulose-binding protein [Nocardia nepalensis]|uniref:expansin EXLX1 family cellulose-binding protein n=1 Tax=Nocardia nepalensis TaxID=3375448 RepID=UPI003B6831D1